MAGSKIKIYKNNPTAGGTDGTLVSSGTGPDMNLACIPNAGF